MNLLVTGGAGFIGSALVRMLIRDYPEHTVLNFDKLTYAGNPDNVDMVAGNSRYRFIQGDIADERDVDLVFRTFMPDAVLHLAAESHVDRSILSSRECFEANLRGTMVLLEAARKFELGKFVHVSTDEVYGSISDPLEADEEFPLKASSPYSASKAGSDLLALSFAKTYGLNVTVTRASNNYGPYQFPEKLIPLMISNAMEGKPLPMYGDGMQVRDWLYVDDHCRALLAVLQSGRSGEIYNIGGTASLPNIEVIRQILAVTGRPESQIWRVVDRPGHDRRYALDCSKLKAETGWQSQVPFAEGLHTTIAWYSDNREWVNRVKSGEYQAFYSRNYGTR
jgi:dTDP-glucose 4,6-dehydratase